MDDKQFAEITKAMGREFTRRGAFGRLVAGLAAAGGASRLSLLTATAATCTADTNPPDQADIPSDSQDSICEPEITLLANQPKSVCPCLGFSYGFKFDTDDTAGYTCWNPVTNQEVKQAAPCTLAQLGDASESVSFSLDGTSVGNSPADGAYLDWSRENGLGAVVMKASTENNLYAYDGDTSDTCLHSPLNSQGEPRGLSHVIFCWNDPLQVEKTAETAYDRDWDWTIDKTSTGTDPDPLVLNPGDTGTIDYQVELTATATDKNITVTGDITITNPNLSADATIVSVNDIVKTGGVGTAANVDCGETFPFVLEAGKTLVCTYTASPPNTEDGINSARVKTDGKVPSNSGQADVDFGDPDNVLDRCVNVNDSVAGPLGQVCAGDDDKTFDYSVEVGPFTADECGPKRQRNGVRFLSTDDRENPEKGSDQVDVDYRVRCKLKVTKDAATELTRTREWDIEKVGDQTDLTLSVGQSFVVNYDVTVSATSTDSDWTVLGTIKIVNPDPDNAAIINTIADVVTTQQAEQAGTVTCPDGVTFPYELAAGGTLECTYEAELSGAFDGTNVAEAVVTEGEVLGDKTGEVPFAFDNDTDVSLVDNCITVSDDHLQDDLGEVCFGGAPKTFEYPLTVGPYEQCGEDDFVNIASFVTDDTGTTGSDSWTVAVDVPCAGGCTLTQGYWKTHSKYGPAKKADDTWNQLPQGPDTKFFSSGKSYIEVLKTAPAGNPYYTLAHQYIAAQLNMLNGASVPPAVQTAFDAATVLFGQYTPAQVALKKTAAEKARQEQFKKLVGALDAYNNGVTGPGHCDEDSSSEGGSVQREAGDGGNDDKGGAERSGNQRGKKRGKSKGKGRKNGRK